MKRKTIQTLLGLEAIACLLLIIFKNRPLGEVTSRGFAALMGFPFRQLGVALRTLSLAGVVGNWIALGCYTIVCLLPLGLLGGAHRKRSLYTEDILLPVLSLSLFIILYFAINPGLLPQELAQMDLGVAWLGSVAYSILTAYMVLRILHSFFENDATHQLHKSLTLLLYALNALFVFLLFGDYFGGLLDSLLAFQAGNSESAGLAVSYLFLLLQYVVNALPYAFNIPVVFAALDLIEAQNRFSYSEAVVTAAEKLSQLCRLALLVSVVSNLAFNLLQFLFLRQLRIINSVVNIPLFPIIFLLTTLLLARYLRESRQLKEENSMFI